MILSVVIPVHNDDVEVHATIKSCIETTLGNNDVEILVVDDCSSQPVVSREYRNTRILRNARRIGCGPSRYVGACLARGMWLLFVDSHMRFSEGWYETWQRECGMNGEAIYCGSCIGLDESNMDLSKAKQQYFGATWNFAGPDRNKPKQMQVFECIWRERPAGYDKELPAIMGASYFATRDFFLRCGALKNLRSWGGDEQELSLMAHMAGEGCFLLENVRIGHKFKKGGLNKIQPWEPIYNKLYVIHTCLPPHLAKRLIDRLPRGGALTTAMQAIYRDWHLVESKRAYNGTIFIKKFEWLLDRFKLDFPKT